MPIEISLPDGRHPKARHRGPGWQSWPTQIYVRAIGLPRAASEWRSEVKEEDRAQSGPGDMSEAAHPLFWAACSADLTRWLVGNRSQRKSTLSQSASSEQRVSGVAKSRRRTGHSPVRGT